MSKLNRRIFLKALGLATTGSLAHPMGLFSQSPAFAQSLDQLYDMPMTGQVRVLHLTDIHAQINPVYFREPNVNLGLGDAKGQLPHVVSEQLLNKLDLAQNSIEAYAYSSLNFEENARKYGKMGGVAHIKTLLDKLREQAGGIENTLTMDGGDLWQGSATSLWTRGLDMVEISNLLNIELLTGHWEFTYTQEELLNNLMAFKGEFIGQNVRVKEDSLFDDAYFELVEKYNGLGLHDEDSGHAFKPYVLKTIAGHNIAIIGQAFPRTGNANPPGFFPDWSFGLREDDLQTLVEEIHNEHSPNAVIMLSHNGMDVDIKMAGQIAGIDAIFGGHTHDGMPQPVEVINPDGKSCLVTNAGTNGKFVGVMDFDIDVDGVKGMHYQMMPVFENLLEADSSVSAYIADLKARRYDESVIESRSQAHLTHPERLDKLYAEILDEELAIAGQLLYRRGNFMGSWDQLICDALRDEYQADVALSPGFRWGTSVLTGDMITMEDVMTQCAMTYGETYVSKMTGESIVNILEQVADNLFDHDPYLQSGGDMVRVGGLDYTINPNESLGQRISALTFDDGTPLDFQKSYKVTGWAVVGAPPDGRLIWDIVRDYIIKSKDDQNTLKLAKINHPTIIGVTDNPGIENYNGKLM